MSTKPAKRAAAYRSTLAARAGMGFGVATVIGLVLTASGSGVGFAVLVVSLGGLYVAVDQHIGLRDLAQIGAVPVSTIAQRPIVLPAETQAAALLPMVATLSSDEHCLVRVGEGYRLLTVAMVTDVALTARGTVHLDVIGRRASTVPAGVAVDRLPRPPGVGETWVIADASGRNPAVLNRAAVAAAIFRLSADAAETPEVNQSAGSVSDATVAV